MSSKANGQVSRRPRGDLRVRDDRVLLEAEGPGPDAAELSVTVAGRVVTFSGHVPRVDLAPSIYEVHPDSVPD